ncbi:MAG: hypothetical protein Q4P05_03620 [Actinomycetaceae bacterium]|nr:hypothetical protein [Actinomycetaceae bacterium]
MTTFPLTHAYLAKDQLELLSPATRSVFKGLEAEKLTVRIGPVTVARDLLSSASNRCGIFQAFVDPDSILSHTTAAWIHWGVGVPFPLTICGPRRHRSDDLIHHVDKRALTHIDRSLPLPVITPALTLVQLFEAGLLADDNDGNRRTFKLYAYAAVRDGPTEIITTSRMQVDCESSVLSASSPDVIHRDADVIEVVRGLP